MSGIICVGLGGALGAVLRYGLSLLPYKGDFPVLTFVTNTWRRKSDELLLLIIS